jgi:hypothetical protein
MRGPRGLLRIGLAGGAAGAELINFIAVEPVVGGAGSRFSRMGFSELEMGADGKRGKRLSVAGDAAGELMQLPAGADPRVQLGGALEVAPLPAIEQLTVRIEVERFAANGAHVYLLARMLSTRPDEVEFSVYRHDDSAPVDELTLTATMGNYARLRRVWLKDRIVDSRDFAAGYQGNGFVDREDYPLEEMLRWRDGDALALATTDEENPREVEVPGAPAWNYKSVTLTQYWRVPARHIQPDLRVRVNARRVYWGSAIPIPGGPAFENFEVRQRYVAGQVFVFGLTPREPRRMLPPVPRLAK